MSIAVIIPVFNRADRITLALRSVLLQRVATEVEIIVVDDGSTDATAKAVENLATQNACITLIRQENAGVSAARNTGLCSLSTDARFVTFLDSDDVMARDRLTKDFNILTDKPDAQITYGNMVITDRIDTQTLIPAQDAQTALVTSLHMSSTLYRRGLLDEIGLFDTSMDMAEDTDLIFRTFERNIRFVQTKTLCHYYLRHPGNMSACFGDKRTWFSRALLKSIKRRKSDPSLKLNLPKFSIDLPEKVAFK